MTTIGSSFSIGVQGVKQGLRDMSEAANKIASPETFDGDNVIGNITEGTVDLVESELATRASINVIKVTDEVIGSLLDTNA